MGEYRSPRADLKITKRALGWVLNGCTSTDHVESPGQFDSVLNVRYSFWTMLLSSLKESCSFVSIALYDHAHGKRFSIRPPIEFNGAVKNSVCRRLGGHVVEQFLVMSTREPNRHFHICEISPPIADRFYRGIN
jgi:hypothetical protein